MKVLLLGEFSGLYKNLKEGLEELGHEAVTASAGDGFKKIPADIDFSSSAPGVLGKIHRKINPLFCVNDLKGYDVVQLVNPFIFYHRFFPNKYFYDRIIGQNDKFFISAAGDDAYFWRYGRKALRYGPFDDFLKYDFKKKTHPLELEEYFEFNKCLVDKSCGVIPIMYEYEVSYQGCDKRLKTIPIAVNLNGVSYSDNVLSGRLVVFHGLSRYGFKGTRFVEEAFDILSRRYPNDLELIIRGHMPLGEYLELMSKANVVIDQVNSYSCGVNGIYAMAMGKVVIGGAEPESLKSHSVASSPVFNVWPSVESIVSAVEDVLERRNQIRQMGEEARNYVEVNHSHTKIAQQYIDLWCGK